MTVPVTKSSIDPMIRAKRLRDRFDAYNKNRDDFPHVTLALAIELAEARQEYDSDQSFGAWLGQNGLDDLGKTDRAAFIRIGERRDVAGIVLEETTSRSPRVIADEIERRFPRSGNQPDPVLLTAKNDANALTTALASDAAADKTDLKKDPVSASDHKIIGSGGDEIKDISKTALVQELGLAPEQYAIVMKALHPHRQRALKAEFGRSLKRKDVTKKRLRQLFDIAVGYAQQNKIPKLSANNAFDARVFMPDVPVAICKYFKLKQLAERADRLMQFNERAIALIAAGASINDLHAELIHLWEKGENRPAPVKKPIELAADDSKNRIKHEVKFCGEIIWPRESLKHVSYQDMNMGWHLVHYWVGYLENARPQKPNEISSLVQHLIQDIAAATSINALTDVMLACMSAYNKINGRKDKADLSNSTPPGLAR
jgi:hypothetical protein